jgi:hypothetical protein
MKKFGVVIAFAALLFIDNVVADMCAKGSKEVSGNWFCQPVQAIQYSNVGSSGSYQQVTNMNSQTGSCQSQTKSYSGPLAPLDEEVSRPTQIKNNFTRSLTISASVGFPALPWSYQSQAARSLYSFKRQIRQEGTRHDRLSTCPPTCPQSLS